METYLLIGGIGSGKSTVARLFEERGAYCLDLDVLGHEVLKDAQVKAELARAYGAEVLDDAGEVDRARLADLAFASEEATAGLGAITQPRIAELALAQLAESAPRYRVALVEASAYAPGFAPLFALEEAASGVIAVTAPEEVRIARAVARGMDEDDARARLARQATDEQRREWADFAIDNSAGLAHLEAQVQQVWQQVS